MNRLTRDEFEFLAATENGKAVSIYLPTAGFGRNTMENPVRLGRALRAAQRQLVKAGLSPPTARAFLHPARELLVEQPFWQIQKRGLALFLTSGSFAGYQLPYPVRERAYVSNAFHLKPLLPLLACDRLFFVLALGLKSITLYRATRYAIESVAAHQPAIIGDEVSHGITTERTRQLGPATPSEPDVVHTRSVAEANDEEHTLRYFRSVNDSLRPLLGNRRAPLLLAGEDLQVSLFRKANTYPHLLDAVVIGNPDERLPDELRISGWEKVWPVFHHTQLEAQAELNEALARDDAVTDVRRAVTLASHGRSKKCFVALNEERWGLVDPATGTVALADESESGARDLLDVTATQTLLQGGDVFPVETVAEVPGNGPLAVLPGC